MSKQRVTFRANEVCIGEESWKLPFPILDLRLVGNNVAIIYDYMAGPRHRQFQNLECFDPDGVKLWTAHHPTNATNDAYVQFVDGEPLAVYNFAGYVCLLDPTTGLLLSAKFTK